MVKREQEGDFVITKDMLDRFCRELEVYGDPSASITYDRFLFAKGALAKRGDQTLAVVVTSPQKYYDKHIKPYEEADLDNWSTPQDIPWAYWNLYYDKFMHERYWTYARKIPQEKVQEYVKTLNYAR